MIAIIDKVMNAEASATTSKGHPVTPSNQANSAPNGAASVCLIIGTYQEVNLSRKAPNNSVENPTAHPAMITEINRFMQEFYDENPLIGIPDTVSIPDSDVTTYGVLIGNQFFISKNSLVSRASLLG